jgi:hypothetical protein
MPFFIRRSGDANLSMGDLETSSVGDVDVAIARYIENVLSFILPIGTLGMVRSFWASFSYSRETLSGYLP